MLQEVKTEKNPRGCQLLSSNSITRAYIGADSADKPGFIDKVLPLQLVFHICSFLKCLGEQ